MKVLMLVHDFPPISLGGEGVVTGEIANRLAEFGLSIEVVCPIQEASEPFDSEQNYAVHRVEVAGKSFVTRTPSFFRASLPIIRSFTGDVIYYNRPAYLRRDMPSVYHLHTTRVGLAKACWKSRAPVHALANLAFTPLEMYMVRSCSKIIALSDHMVDTISEFYSVERNTIGLLPNSIDTAKWQTVSDRSYDGGRLLYVGRLDRAKGILDLITAFRSVVQHGLAKSLTIVGDGPLQGYLASIIRKDGLEGLVKFQKFAHQDYLREIYIKHDLLILPSYYDGFGMVIAEAMACGTPTISTDKCVYLGQPQYPAGDKVAMVRMLGDLLSKPASLKKIAQEGAEAVRKLNADVLTKQLVAYFDQAMKSARKSSSA
jgi:glycosyltransferase involved in cell wall biosynthesis